MIHLIQVGPEGVPESPTPPLPDVAKEALAATASLYRRVGYVPPWVNYIAVENAAAVGLCAFKSPPEEGRVEIAYFTLPGYEGRGVGTQMAAELIRIAIATSPEIRVAAQTLPQPSASTRILEKAGFRLAGTVEHPEDGTVWEWHLTTGHR